MAECPDWSQPESAIQLPTVARGMREVTRFIQNRAQSFIINHGNLKDWHLRVFKGAVPKSYYAGNFRSEDPSRPCLAAAALIGPHQGVDYHLVPSEMSSYSSALHTNIVETDSMMATQPSFANKVSSSLKLAAWGVGRFVQIHPFLNGNGRTSRLLANYFFVRYGLGIAHFESLPRPGGDYGAAMERCMVGEFGPLYKYFVILLATQKST
jgi:fido (protein-threonine AMPylation protein)